MRGELTLAWPKCYKKVARPGVYTSAGIGDGASLKLLQVWLVVELLRVPFGELFWIRWHSYYCCTRARACVRGGASVKVAIKCNNQRKAERWGG